jgi:DNA primase
LIEPPHLFSALRQPGIPLLVELIALARERPGITVGALLEHFAGREELPALEKLAVADVPGKPDAWADEFLDGLRELDRQTIDQRIAELHARQRTHGLDDTEKDELRACLAQRPRLASPPRA